MNIKRWLRKKSQEPVEPPKPQTRAAVLFGLFCEWQDKPFVYCGLVGIADIAYHLGILYNYYTGSVDIQYDNTVVLGLEKGYRHQGATVRAIVYDKQYSDQLDAYIVALREAIEERKEVARVVAEAKAAQRIKEETQF